MKKHQWILFGITGASLCLLLGIFIGRNLTNAYIPVNKVITSTQHNNDESNIAPDIKIDINTASLQQLELLPGVGKELAQRILDYRTERGKFISLKELMNVNGIGEKKFEQIEPYIKIGGSYENTGS